MGEATLCSSRVPSLRRAQSLWGPLDLHSSAPLPHGLDSFGILCLLQCHMPLSVCALHSWCMLKGIKTRYRGMLKGIEARYRGMLKGIKTRYRGMLKGIKARYRGMLKGIEARYRGMLKGIEARHRGMLKGIEARHRVAYATVSISGIQCAMDWCGVE